MIIKGIRLSLSIASQNLYSLKYLLGYFYDFFRFRNMGMNAAFSLGIKNLYPCIADKTSNTPIEPIYFLQSNWCIEKLAKAKPKNHTDVGSSALMVSLLSKFIPTTMVDIRPLPLKTVGLQFIKGDILHLPFKENTVGSLSSICVIEHIGLGRYGDPLDPWGSEKAALELMRVLKPGGNLYISLPVDCQSRVYFNAHRSFTRKHVLNIFKKLILVEEKYIYANDITDRYHPEKGFGTGLYHFRKQ